MDVSSGKQLLPLSCSLHAGVSQLAGQGLSGGTGAVGGTSTDVNNLIRMRGQALGQSAPSLTGLVSKNGKGSLLILFQIPAAKL